MVCEEERSVSDETVVDGGETARPAGPGAVPVHRPPTPSSVRPSDLTWTSRTPESGDGEDAAEAADAAVSEALRVLEGLEQKPLSAHVAAFDAVHGALQDRLADAEG